MNPLVNIRLYTFSGVPGSTLSIATSEKCSPFFPHSHIVTFAFAAATDPAPSELAPMSLVPSAMSSEPRGDGSADDPPGRARRQTL